MEYAVRDRKKLRIWYISNQRAGELFAAESLPPRIQEALVRPREPGNNMLLARSLEPAFLDVLCGEVAPSLYELVARDSLVAGNYFILEATFRSVGLAASCRSPLVTLSSGVDGVLGGRQLRLSFGKDGLTCQTAYSHLQGRPKVFVLGCIASVSDEEVVALPIIVADLLDSKHGIFSQRFSEGLQVFASDIAQFSHIDFTRRVSAAEMSSLKLVPEVKVKQVFADIFGEVDPPNDWGGEECDLFSSNVVVRGRKRNAAFLLKGPAKFHEMTMADCGKNGDQVYRLFNTGADLFVVQHCHRVSPAVRRTVEAFALAESRRDVGYLILDGCDTYRVLKSQSVV